MELHFQTVTQCKNLSHSMQFHKRFSLAHSAFAFSFGIYNIFSFWNKYFFLLREMERERKRGKNEKFSFSFNVLLFYAMHLHIHIVFQKHNILSARLVWASEQSYACETCVQSQLKCIQLAEQQPSVPSNFCLCTKAITKAKACKKYEHVDVKLKVLHLSVCMRSLKKYCHHSSDCLFSELESVSLTEFVGISLAQMYGNCGCFQLIFWYHLFIICWPTNRFLNNNILLYGNDPERWLT